MRVVDLMSCGQHA